MNILKGIFLFPCLALIILVFALSSQLFDVFPIGKVLDPFAGAVQNDASGRLNDRYFALKLPGLSDTVHVFYDERKVPHIYAVNQEDLYFAQGYVTASLRLWQMDFLAYAGAGRLSEVFNKVELLEYDRNQRRMGIPDAAERSLQLIRQDPETGRALNAYTRGVNAYIRELNYKTMPLEYKIFDYEPEPWSDLKSALIMKNMANSMTGYGEDLFLSKMMLALGEDDFNKLYPDFNGHITPVMDTAKPAVGSAPPRIRKPPYLDYSFFSSNPVIEKEPYNPRLGSNSWVISGRKTKSGFPILASDPHLGLSLPSIWIEMQLCAPGMNVYGVSIPGTPAVLIGFNGNIAWGLTNGADDVKDWYKLKISADYKKYELDGVWRDLKYRISEIKRKGQKPFYDTLYSTAFGPVVTNKSFPGHNPDLMDNALKWELHNASNEFLAFILLNKAGNYREYKEAIKHYSCPLQNFTFACKDNTIAVNHQGSLAVKRPGQGKFILDGTRSGDLYTRYIPADSLPQLLDPACGFVLSANQHPTYFNYPYYYDGYFSETRANRIRQLLETKNDFDIASTEAVQLDNTSSFSAAALPVLIKNIEKDKLNGNQVRLLDSLGSWKGDYGFNDEQAMLYKWWWQYVTDNTWDELKNFPFFIRPPEDYVLLDLIQHDPSNSYFDKQSTPEKEHAGDIITQSFIAASEDYKTWGKGRSRKWGDHNLVNIMHPTNLPAFSMMHVPSAGNPEAINAISSNWGPSWRMIVQLGDRPMAYGIYPGGQSGNAGSPYYDDFIKDWNKGKYYRLHFFESMAEARAYISGAGHTGGH